MIARPSEKIKQALQEFKSLQEEYGDQDVHLDELKRKLFEEYPDEFDSNKWRFVLKGKAFEESFEFSEEDNWIRLKNSSNEE